MTVSPYRTTGAHAAEEDAERARRVEEMRNRVARGEPLFEGESAPGTEDGTMADKCAVPGCEKPAKTRGVCGAHYFHRRSPEVSQYMLPSRPGGRTHPSGPKPIRRKALPGEGMRAESPAPILAAGEAVEDGRIVVRISLELAEAIIDEAHKAVVQRAIDVTASGEDNKAQRFDALVETVINFADLCDQVNAGRTGLSQQVK
jgi:hypothetical protein